LKAKINELETNGKNKESEIFMGVTMTLRRGTGLELM
jgi:hypothetical protein